MSLGGSPPPGKTWKVALNRKSGNLPAGGRPFSARETPKGALMRPSRPGGRAMTRRLRTAVFLFSLASVSTPLSLFAADVRDVVAGTVVDQDGRPLPRVRVRVLPGLDAAI